MYENTNILFFICVYAIFFVPLPPKVGIDINVRIISEDNYCQYGVNFCQLYGYILFFELNEVAALLGNSKRKVRVIVNEF